MPCHRDGYCINCDLLVGLDGLHVIGVERDDGGGLVIAVESAEQVMGCPACGVVASSHGRRVVRLVDAPSFGRPVELRWRKRTWECPEPSCPVGVFTEQDEQVAKPRAMLTGRACRWAVHQIRREHGSVSGVARQLGTAWKTVWGSIKPILDAAAAEESRFGRVTTLGVDEHIWHHVNPLTRGPKELTGMVDLTRDKHGHTRARLLDLVPGRSGTVYADWLKARGDTFRKQVQVATLDPFRGYKNAIDDQLADATAVLDAFHVVKLATQAVDEVRRRVQQDIHGHRGRKNDPLYRIRNILRSAVENLTDRQQNRLADAIAADERHDEVHIAWQCAQRVRAVYHANTPAAGRALAETILASFPSCPIPEIARLGKTLKQWRNAFLGYFTTGGANNGGTEAVNGLIELHRRIARGFRNRDNYRLRMLLIAGGLDVAPTAGVKSHAGHSELLGRIGDVGLLVSELPPGATPTRHRFLARNRLLAALSGATVIPEAGPRSGSMTTVIAARELGRGVGAVPGPVTSVASAGPNELIKQGFASLVTHTGNVIDLLDADRSPDRAVTRPEVGREFGHRRPSPGTTGRSL